MVGEVMEEWGEGEEGGRGEEENRRSIAEHVFYEAEGLTDWNGKTIVWKINKMKKSGGKK